MPITVKHTPVGSLGRLALAAGQAQGRQLQAARDLQLTSIALAAENRVAPLRRATGDRAFALQRAGAAQVARERPDTLIQQKRLLRSVAEAKTAGIYEPAQISRMEILANLGDEKGVMSLLRTASQPTLRRRRIQEELTAVDDLQRSNVAQVQEQLDVVNNRLGQRFLPETQQFLRENPRFADEETTELLAQQGQLGDLLAKSIAQTERMKKGLRLGLTLQEQISFKSKQEAQQEKRTAEELKREVARTKASGELSDKQAIAIDTIRNQEKEQRVNIGRQIASLRKELVPFEDENEEETAERVAPINTQIRQLELQRVTSFGREKERVGKLLTQGRGGVVPTLTDSTGQRWRFTGRYRNNKPVYEVIE